MPLKFRDNSINIVAYHYVREIKKAENANFDIAILDDGLQDKNISYNLEFVCFDAENWIGNGMLIPSGPLRDKINCLKNFDIVFLNGHLETDNKIIKEIKSINSKIKIFKTEYVPKNLEIFDKNLKVQLVNFVQGLRNLDLKKLPSVSETIDWARSLVLLNVKSLEPNLVRETLNILLKFQTDIDVSDPEIDNLIEQSKK